MLVVARATAVMFRRHIASVLCAGVIALVRAWLIVASRVFSLGVVQSLSFADALGILGIAVAGLTAHELSTERVVHSLAPHRERIAAVNESRVREPVGG